MRPRAPARTPFATDPPGQHGPQSVSVPSSLQTKHSRWQQASRPSYDDWIIRPKMNLHIFDQAKKENLQADLE